MPRARSCACSILLRAPRASESRVIVAAAAEYICTLGLISSAAARATPALHPPLGLFARIARAAPVRPLWGMEWTVAAAMSLSNLPSRVAIRMSDKPIDLNARRQARAEQR